MYQLQRHDGFLFLFMLCMLTPGGGNVANGITDIVVDMGVGLRLATLATCKIIEDNDKTDT